MLTRLLFLASSLTIVEALAVLVAPGAKGQKQLSMELFSPKASVGLTLQGDTFTLYSQQQHYDMLFRSEIASGVYRYKGDTLLLLSRGRKTYTLLRETEEVFDPIDVDSVWEGQEFLAWELYFKNGASRQGGGWNSNDCKEGVWQYYDSTGRVTNRILYHDGQLVTDHFTFRGEK